MPDLPFYPAVILVAIAVAGAASYFAGVPLATAVVLLLAGVAVSGFIGYKPTAASTATQPPGQRLAQRIVARAFRLAIGTLVLAFATVAALYFSGQVAR
jgi:hypothetical protein